MRKTVRSREGHTPKKVTQLLLLKCSQDVAQRTNTRQHMLKPRTSLPDYGAPAGAAVPANAQSKFSLLRKEFEQALSRRQERHFPEDRVVCFLSQHGLTALVRTRSVPERMKPGQQLTNRPPALSRLMIISFDIKRYAQQKNTFRSVTASPVIAADIPLGSMGDHSRSSSQEGRNTLHPH